MSDFTVTAKIGADISNFQNGISKATSGLKSLFSSSSGGGRGMVRSFMGAQLAANAVTKAVGYVTNGIGSMVGELSDSSKAWQTFDGNMKMLGKSSSEIDKARNSMQDFAERSVYSASDMATTYAQMSAIGTKNVDQLVKGMGGIAAASENPKQAMKTLSTQMTQALTKPKMTWADFKFMLDQAPAGMSAVAKEMGMSLDDLVRSIQDGEVSSKDFAQAVAKVGTNKSFSAMATQAKTAGQALDGLKEGLANKLMPAFQTLDKIAISAIKSIGRQLDKINFDGLKDKIMQARFAVISFFKGFEKSGAIKSLQDAFKSLGEAVKNVVGAFTGASPKAVDLGQAFGNLAKKIADTVKAVADFVAGLDPGVIQGFAKGALAAAVAFKGLKTAFKIKGIFDELKQNPFDALTKNARKSKSTIAQIIKSLGSVLKDFGTGTKSVLQGAGTLVKEFGVALKSAFTGLKPVLQGFGDMMSKVIQGASKGFANILKGFGQMTKSMNPVNMIVFAGAIAIVIAALTLLATQGEGVKKIFEGLGSVVQSVGAALGIAFTGLGEGIGRALQGLGQGIAAIVSVLNLDLKVLADAFVQLAEVVGRVVVGIVEAIAPFMPAIMEMVAVVVSHFPQIIDAFSGLVGTIGEAVANIVVAFQPIVQAVTEMVTAVVSQLPLIITAFSGLVESIGGAVANIVTAFQPIVQAVTEMVTNIVSQLPAIITAFSGLVGEIGSAVAGIISAIQPIVTTVADMVVQVVAQLPAIITAFSGLAESIGSAISGIIDSITGLLSAVEPIIQAFGDLFVKLGEGIKTALDGVTGVLEGFAEVIRAPFEGAQKVIEAFGKAVEGILQRVKDVIAEIGETAGKLADAFGQVTDSIAGLQGVDLLGIGLGLLKIGNGIKEIANAGLETVASGLTSIGSALGGIFRVSALATDFQALKSAFSGFPSLDTIASGLSGIGSALGGIFRVSALATDFTALKTSLTGLDSVANTASSGLKEVGSSAKTLGSAMNSLKSQFTQALNSMKSTATSVLNSIKSTFTSSMNSMKSTVTSGMNGIKSSFTSGFQAINSAVSSAMSRVQSTVTSTMSSVVSAMNSAAGQARSAGYNMGMGFYNGLSSMSYSIIGLAMSIASRAASAMRSALRIHSPSRVTDKIGGYTGEGFYDGMQDWIKPVSKIGEQLGLAGVPSINDSDLARLGTMSTGSYSFDGGELSVSQKPAELTLNLGSQSYKTFVEDIMNTHSQQVDLSLNY